MAKFILKRVILGLLTLFLVSVVVFAATQALPGNAAVAILGRNATPERVAALTRQLHGQAKVVLKLMISWFRTHRISRLFSRVSHSVLSGVNASVLLAAPERENLLSH